MWACVGPGTLDELEVLEDDEVELVTAAVADREDDEEDSDDDDEGMEETLAAVTVSGVKLAALVGLSGGVDDELIRLRTTVCDVRLDVLTVACVTTGLLLLTPPLLIVLFVAFGFVADVSLVLLAIE